MRRMRSSTLFLLLPSLLGIILPMPVLAEGVHGTSEDAKTLDVALNDAGLFLGQVVDAEGHTKGEVKVSLRQVGREIISTETDDAGRFAVSGLPAGTYDLVSASGHVQVRVWKHQAAPPNAVRGALVVDGLTVRGQGVSDPVPSQPLPPGQYSLSEEMPSGEGETAYTSGMGEMGQTVVENSPPVWNETPYYGPPRRPRSRLLSTHWIWAAGVATAIAVPIALDDDDAS